MAHTAEQLAHEHRRYLQVFGWLALLTAVEVGIIYMPLPKLAIAGSLVLLAASKAALVALFYMHLAVEKRTLAWIALTPAILCVLLVLALMPDHTSLGRLLTRAPATPPPAAAPHH